MPDVYHDPRSLAMEQGERSAMHAKCVVIDEEVALVTSANFTTAAQTKNIEIGALLRVPDYARLVTEYFESLIREGALCVAQMPVMPPEAPS